ncbi:hypothetical protein OG352_05340 [Streptomyces sp. NBC_01485]|uniref:hypothetical protein n=1 Tax=Streptomyces sp. NBC_01485 TaxID=2903884 RepID=UPI002E318BC8|nr:hypothetical protein [Streptomyces sp. NBC_01485]
MSRPHGYARYRLDGCRCYVCGWAVAQYNDAREHAMRRGTWQPWTDATPVRAHLERLADCGMGLRRIAALAGVDRKRLQAVLHGRPERGTGPQEKVRPALAAAVLAVEPTLENLSPSTLISPHGTRRRVHALVAVGWPQHHLAIHLGMTPSNFTQMLARDHVLVRRALAARAMYDALWRADPAEHGASTGGIARARRYAAVHAWPPPGAWDDDRIDDPEAHPDWTGQCGTPEGFWAHRYIKVPACQPCRDAFNADRRARKATTSNLLTTQEGTVR